MTTLTHHRRPVPLHRPLEEEVAPATCAAFTGLLPFRNQLIQARWSGKSAWIPLGDFEVGVGFENATSHPAPGEILFYPGGSIRQNRCVSSGPAMGVGRNSTRAWPGFTAAARK